MAKATAQEQLKRLVDESKIHKLINRIYLNDRISIDQFNVVYNYICKKGTKTSINQTSLHLSYWNGGYPEFERVNTPIEGHFIFGMFAYEDTLKRNVIVYCDVRYNKVHRMLYYPNENIIVNG